MTPRLLANPRFDETFKENAARTPLGKLAEPSDIAGALLFLSLPLAGHITGEELTVDGGLRNAWPLALPR
jgi:NAD(P)-dependent dehydrogenase (short-subunit alcohol dehydrogenase family)